MPQDAGYARHSWPARPTVRQTANISVAALLCALSLCAASGARAQTAASTGSTPPAKPSTVTLPEPEMAGSLAFTAPPTSFTGPLGKWYVDGVLSGLGLLQSNATARDRSGLADLSNGQVIVQKIDGIVQFYAQIGAYSIPALGTQYSHQNDMANALGNYYGAVPEVFLKIAPSDRLSIEVGKLPTLIGGEQTFTFENYNIERGLLWNQTPGITRGVQVTYAAGPLTLNVSVNDGYYSNRYNWVSGSATWRIDAANSLEVIAGDNLGRTATSTTGTPLAQNNSWIYDVIYTFTKGKLTVSPYFQSNHVHADPRIGLYGATAYSGAVLANYVFTPMFQLAARGEYISTSGRIQDAPVTNLLYGAGSNAFSVTLTPTVIYQRFFARTDLAVVDIGNLTPGDGFGRHGDANTQFRGVFETGIIF